MKKWLLALLCIAMLLIPAVPGFAETPPTAPTFDTQPVDLSLTYGYTDGNVLSVSASAAGGYTLSYQWFSNTNASNEGGTPINGATGESYAVPVGKHAGTTEYYYCVVTATRTDNGQTAETVSNVATVSIGKATPTVTAPTVDAVTYGESLSWIPLTNPTGNIPGEWSWMEDDASNINEEYIPDAGEYTFQAKFTPDDTVNYNETTKDVSVTVTKAKLEISIGDNSEIYGEPRDVVVRCNVDYDGEVTILVGDKETTPAVTKAKDGLVIVGHEPMNVGKYDIKVIAAETKNYKQWEETLIQGLKIRPVPNPAFIQPAVIIGRGTSYDLSRLVSVAQGTVSFALDGTPDGYSLSGNTLTLADNAADSCKIKVTVDGGNYESAEGDITVTAESLSTQENFKFDDLSLEKTYGDEDFTVAATGAETGSSVTYSSSDPTVATVEAATGKVHILKVGKVTITATAGATEDRAQATACCWLTVNPKPVTISGVKAEDMEYGGPPYMTLDTSGAVIAGKLEGDDLTVSAGGAIYNLNVGESSVIIIYTLGGAAAGNYTLAKEGQQETTTVNILPKPVTVSGITAVEKTYDGTTEATLDYTNVSIKDEKDELVFGDLTVTATGAFADKNVGDIKTVTISGLKLVGQDAENYKLAESGQQETAFADITAKEVGLIWTNTRLTYTGEAQKPNVTVTGLVEGEACTVTVTGEQTNAGAGYTATAGGLSSNYKLPGNKTVTFKISKIIPDVTTMPTATGITYGQTLAKSRLRGGAGSVDGSFAWKDLTVAPGVSDSQTTEYDVVFTPTDTDNYYEVERKLKLTVEQKEVGLKWNASLTYNGSAQAPTAEATGLVNNDEIGVTVIGAQTNAGTDYTATASVLTGEKAGNYKLPVANTTTFAIGKAPLTVTAKPKAITYGDAPANDGVTYSGFVNSETENDLNGTLAYDYNYTQYGDAGSYTITPKSLTSENYEITFKPGTLTVGQKEVGLSWSTAPLTFSGLPQAPAAEATGLVNNDKISVTVIGAQTNAGTGYTATASGLTGDKVGNYKLPDAKTTTFAIGKAPLTVTAKPKAITYGDAPANDGVTYSGFVNSETESVLGGTLAYAYSYAQYGDVGNNYTITPSGLTSGNYDISFVAGTLTVEQKEVGLTWSGTALTYNGSAQAPTAEATGLVNNDTIGVSVSGAQTNAGTGYTATASSLTGDKAGNYKLPGENTTTTFAIGKAPLTVTAKPKAITYGDAPVNDGVEYFGFVNNETESVLGGTPDYDYSYAQYGNAGIYDITPKGLTAANYEISFSPGTLTVGQKEVSLTWGDTALTYNGLSQAPTAQATGTVNGDTIDVTVSGAQTNAGTGYTATASGLTGDRAGNYKLPATGLTQEFSIGKAAAQTIADVTDTLVFTLTSVSKSVAGKMPENAGTLSYAAGNATTTGNVTVSDFAVDNSGNATAELSGGAAGDTVTLPVTISSTNYADSTVKVVITLTDKGTQTITADNVTVTYGDTDKKISATTDGNGAISYAVKNGSEDYIGIASDGKLTIRKVPADGKAYVTVTAAETLTYQQATKEVTVTINKANSTVTKAPEAKTLTYNGSAQELVTAGEATGGTLYYAVTTENTAPTDENLYTTSIPTRTDAGIYYVWYKVDGDDNHSDTEAACITPVIAPEFGDPDFAMPEDLTAIDESAFEGVTSMKAVDAHSCTAIGQDAFKGTGLEKIRLPKNCVISDAAFDQGGLIFVYAPSGGSTEAYCAGHDNLIFIEE